RARGRQAIDGHTPSPHCRHVQRLDIWDRLSPQRLENRAAGGKAVRHPRFIAVLAQGGAPFAPADVNQEAGLCHALELLDETPVPRMKSTGSTNSTPFLRAPVSMARACSTRSGGI